eukprot:2317471-Lingulodinium_polyedra.AAC.1
MARASPAATSRKLHARALHAHTNSWRAHGTRVRAVSRAAVATHGRFNRILMQRFLVRCALTRH